MSNFENMGLPNISFENIDFSNVDLSGLDLSGLGDLGLPPGLNIGPGLDTAIAAAPVEIGRAHV